MRYVARVTTVLRSDVHKLGIVSDGAIRRGESLPLPNRVEIVAEGGADSPCMVYRCTDADEFCGDTWHERLNDAFSQARLEYGLEPQDFAVQE